jgi:hypothetical protein
VPTGTLSHQMPQFQQAFAHIRCRSSNRHSLILHAAFSTGSHSYYMPHFQQEVTHITCRIFNRNSLILDAALLTFSQMPQFQQAHSHIRCRSFNRHTLTLDAAVQTSIHPITKITITLLCVISITLLHTAI